MSAAGDGDDDNLLSYYWIVYFCLFLFSLEKFRTQQMVITMCGIMMTSKFTAVISLSTPPPCNLSTLQGHHNQPVWCMASKTCMTTLIRVNRDTTDRCHRWHRRRQSLMCISLIHFALAQISFLPQMGEPSLATWSPTFPMRKWMYTNSLMRLAKFLVLHTYHMIPHIFLHSSLTTANRPSACKHMCEIHGSFSLKRWVCWSCSKWRCQKEFSFNLQFNGLPGVYEYMYIL